MIDPILFDDLAAMDPGEIGGEVKLLFDRTVSRHLPLDIVYALGVTVCRTLLSFEVGS